MADRDHAWYLPVIPRQAQRSRGAPGRRRCSKAEALAWQGKEGKLPEGPPEGTKIPRAQLIDLASKAGLTLDGEKTKILPYQVFLVLRKP